MQQFDRFSDIELGNTVTVVSGDKKGDIGKVLAIDRKERSHYIFRGYHILFPDGNVVDFECITPKTDKGKDMAKPLDLEKVAQAKPADGKVSAKPPAAKPKAIEPQPEPAKK